MQKQMILEVRKELLVSCFALLLTVLVAGIPRAGLAGEGATSKAEDWPRQVDIDGDTVAIFEPQIESFKKKRIRARSAFSVTEPGKSPLFGAMRYKAELSEDSTKKRIRFSKVDILDIKLPGENDQDVARLKKNLNQSLGALKFSMARERFEANQDEHARGKNSGESFENDPPKIYYEQAPAVLVLIDGDPILKEVEGGYYKYVVNTAFFIVLDPDSNYYYLKGGRWWYRTHDLKEAWQPLSRPPAPIQEMADQAFTGDAADSDSNVAELKEPPKIIVSTEPAELIVTNGKPKYVSIEGTTLLYLDNTERDVLVEIKTQKFYVLISGRWYASPALKGTPWKHVPADELPADFGLIPADSGVAGVRASVAGTEEAGDAVLASAVPTVSEVARAGTTLEVMYDGEPKLVRIRGTRVYYAANADKDVLKIGGRFYAVDNGVWFEADSPDGPWIVATVVPAEVDEIPPSAPVYHVRYVHIYDTTPDVVYVGYTHGYYCSYVYHGTVIYGTGYYYHPWYRVYYYPHPVTFGFGVHYNPYTGWWGFPVGVSYGWISFSWFPCPFGYFGPAGYLYGYRHGYYHAHRHGYYHGYRNGYRHGYSAGRSMGYRAVDRKPAVRRPATRNVSPTRVVRPHDDTLSRSPVQRATDSRRIDTMRTSRSRSKRVIRPSGTPTRRVAPNTDRVAPRVTRRPQRPGRVSTPSTQPGRVGRTPQKTDRTRQQQRYRIKARPQTGPSTSRVSTPRRPVRKPAPQKPVVNTSKKDESDRQKPSYSRFGGSSHTKSRVSKPRPSPRPKPSSRSYNPSRHRPTRPAKKPHR